MDHGGGERAPGRSATAISSSPASCFPVANSCGLFLVSNSKKKSSLNTLKHDHFIETTYTVYHFLFDFEYIPGVSVLSLISLHTSPYCKSPQVARQRHIGPEPTWHFHPVCLFCRNNPSEDVSRSLSCTCHPAFRWHAISRDRCLDAPKIVRPSNLAKSL